MSKIASADNTAMNTLYKAEMVRVGKTAAEGDFGDTQAFQDHKEYLSVVEDVLAEDKTQKWDPNDPLLD
jgi:hypothetical protein